MDDRPYDDIPRTGGAHRKQIDEEHSGLNVRAPFPPSPEQQENAPSAPAAFQLSFNESTGAYRVRAWKDEVGACEAGYGEVSRHQTRQELAASLEDVAPGRGFVVLESSETGEVFVEQEVNLRDDWTQDGRFDQITLFEDEEAASAYAADRQGE